MRGRKTGARVLRVQRRIDRPQDQLSVCFSGSRTWTDEQSVLDVLRSLPEGTRVNVGDCPQGLDKLVRHHVDRRRHEVHVYEAQWLTLGKKAGPLRNRRMLVDSASSTLYAFVDDLNAKGSPGTHSCMQIATAMGIQIIAQRASTLRKTDDEPSNDNNKEEN